MSVHQSQEHTAVKSKKYFKFTSLSIFGLLGATSEKSRGGTGEGLHSHMGSQKSQQKLIAILKGVKIRPNAKPAAASGRSERDNIQYSTLSFSD